MDDSKLPSTDTAQTVSIGSEFRGADQDPSVSSDLANSIFAGCIHGLRLSSLEQSISLFRDAPSNQQPVDQSYLSEALLVRFFQTFQLDDFQEAFNLRLDVIEAHAATGASSSDAPEIPKFTPGTISYDHTSEKAALALLNDFRKSADAPGLDRCILLYRDAIRLQNHADLHRCTSLNGLASALVIRYLSLTHISDLDECVSLYRQILEVIRILSPPLRLFPLLGLAATLLMRFATSGDKQDLMDAGSLIPDFSNALEDRSALLRQARACLLKCDEPGQLNEAISFYQEAATFLPIRRPDRPSLLNDLANAVSLRFSDNGQLSDLEYAVKLYHEALQYYSVSHPSYSNISSNLGKTLMRMYSASHILDHLDLAMDAFRGAVECELSPSSVRFNTAREWAQCAHTHHHSSALEAYRSAIGLLPRFSLLGAGSFQSRRSIVASVTAHGLCCSAASCAIREGQLDEAVEILEGRAIFWTQALQLQTPLDELMSQSPVLGDKLKNISKELEQVSVFEASNLNKGMSVEKEKSYFQGLHADYLSTLEEIRQLENFHDFLLPKSMASLQLAASNGPVVILTAAVEAGCDALVLTLDGVHHVPLPSIAVIQVEALRRLLQVAVSPNGTRSAFTDSIYMTLKDVILPHNSQRYMKQVSPIGQGSEDQFRVVLSTLWNHIAKPILQSLNLKRSNTPPRLWWCATGPFAFLPIHAAGIYDLENGQHESVSDYVISSYTPTLSTLLTPPATSTSPFKVVVVIQPEIPNEPRLRLPCTYEELTKIQEYIPSQNLVALGTLDTPTSIQAVLDHLSDASIVHFACHGQQFPNDPLKSSLLLTDGNLEISRIIKHPTPNALLAFLSACETAMGDEELPDEVIHIAATMLFAGFRGVVATMWTIHDQDGPKIAESFYHHIFHHITRRNSSTRTKQRFHKFCTRLGHLCRCQSDIEKEQREDNSLLCPDTKGAAQALHLAVQKLRSEKDCSFQRWVPFIHLGL